ncbi:MAG TPA: bifunctional riboflavin kinase/FAD synthetase [Gemmatimonadales bacterium]|nr:bifunctional riboflavin kinase/FAD synthetase [Gemmatimonadales bacterium]
MRVLPIGPEGSVVTVGTFDGVHLGHRAVLDEIARRAQAAGRKSVLVTFEPHPLVVVNPQMAPPLLTTGGERQEALALTALDYVDLLRFDRELAALAPDAFVERYLVDRLGVRELVIGYDHGFGRGRSGDVGTLRALGERFGFGVDVVGPVEVDGHAVSSTLVRRAVGGGDLALAARLLGRPYGVVGRVEHGAGRGRTIGIPTANLGGVPAAKLLPPDGVYAAWVETRRGRYGAMLNQGPKPTFEDGRRSIEVHLFGFEGDLYGEWIRVEWVRRLRDVERFRSVDALIGQLTQDRAQAEAVLAEARGGGVTHP